MASIPIGQSNNRQSLSGYQKILIGPSYSLDSSPIAELPSKHNALALGIDFACGHRKFVGIGGPSGWGKSELLAYVSKAMTRIHGCSIQVASASQWALSQYHGAAEPILILDDLQDAIKSPRLRHRLRVKLDQRCKRTRPTIICQSGNLTDILKHRIIPSPKLWHLAQISEPSPVERMCITRQIALSEDLRLNAAIESLIATHLNGNGRSIKGAMLRLKLIKSDWHLDSDFAEACGILMPYMIGQDGWDPRDVALEAVHHVFLAWPNLPPLTKRATLAYVLNQLVRLPEEEVAQFLRISTGQVYRHCRNINDRGDCSQTSEFLDIVRIHVFAALADSTKWLE